MSLKLENKKTEPINRENKMEDQEKKDFTREEIYSRVIRAGKRTYFFDVKATRSGEQYLTLTESKRRFNNENGKYFYEKHKIFLYQEDFEKFNDGLQDVIKFIETGEKTEIVVEDPKANENTNPHVDVEFEDLGPAPSEIE